MALGPPPTVETEAGMRRARRRRRTGVSLRLLPVLLLAALAGPLSLGAPGGGIGGTGITGFGPIQGFGSIFVNGREYFLGPRTRYTVDGHPAGRTALRVGDTVVVRGTGAPGRRTGRAAAVAVRHPLVGPVQALAPDGRGIVVFGQRVRIPAGTPVASAGGDPVTLRRGDWVAVSALGDGRGRWVATRVAVRHRAGAAPAGVRAVLEGRVTAAGPGGVLQVGAQPVRLRGGPMPARGAAVRIVGRYRAGVIVAARALPERPDLGGRGRYVEMAGYPTMSANGTLHSNGVVLRPVTRLAAPERAELHRDRPLVFAGRIGADGALDLLRVEPPRAPSRPHAERGGAEHGAQVERPEGAHTEGGKPEIERPEIRKPEIEPPEIQRPQIERPQIERPQIERPEIQHPEIEMPGH